MPRRRLSFLAVVLVPAAAHFACVSKEDSPGFFLDAGSPNLDGSASDSAPTEAGTPQPEAGVDAGPAPVTVNVVKDGQPEANVTIVFSDATGALIDSAKTDATGRASHLLPAGSQVTALLGTADDARILTIVGVEPGDALVAIDAPPFVGASSPTATITALPASPPGTPLGYDGVIGGCGGGFQAPPSQIYVSEGCAFGGKFPTLVTAQGDGFDLGFTFKKGNTLAADGGNVDVDMSGSTWSTAMPKDTLTVSNVPAGLQNGRLAHSEVADHVALPNMQNFDVTTDAGLPPQPFATHPGYADFIQSEATVSAPSAGSAVNYATIATRSAPLPDGGTTNFDLSQLLPFITDAGVDSTNATRPSVSWTTASAVTADGAIVRMQWSFTPDGGTFSNVSSWTVVAPATVNSVTVPALPATESAWAPPAGATFDLPVIAIVEASFVTSYAQLRTTVAEIPQTPALISDQYAPIAPALPVDGTLRMTAFTAQGD